MHWGLIKVSNSPSASVWFPCVLHMRCRQRFWSVHPYAGTVFFFPRVSWSLKWRIFSLQTQTEAASSDMWFGCSKVMSKCIRVFFVSSRLHWIRVREWRKRILFQKIVIITFFCSCFGSNWELEWCRVCVCRVWWLQRRKPKVEFRTEWKKELFSQPNYLFFPFCVKRRI